MGSTNACLPCRKVKMKCATTRGKTACDRCSRKALECLFREHRRGRKPGVRLARKSRDSQGAIKHPQDEPLHIRERDPDFWAEPDGFQPHSLLNRLAMRGKFSLQNILSVEPEPRDSRPRASAVQISPDDPVLLGLINTQVALSFLDYFMQKLNPYISQLDPALHSFEYLRKSPFLLTTVLTAAAKAFQSGLYPTLHAHAERLFADSFRRGDKSTEIIQAILLLTYWKEPNDTRAWISVGLAIRIAMDLGWHRLSTKNNQEADSNETTRREQRNIERTMLVLFVYDRSLSLQTGKPWMIEKSEFIESAESWWKHPLAIPNDRLLCSFVTLRLLTADTFDLLVPVKQSPASRHERLLASLHEHIHLWQRKWLEVVHHEQPMEILTCHSFLIRLYGCHSRLQLSSIPLQSLRPGDLNSPAVFWLSYETAVEMLQLIADSSPVLYLAQDPIHVMTAYAAIFLIKLLLSSPLMRTPEIEQSAKATIRDVATTFGALSGPPTSSCSYQARFLENILSEFDRVKRQPSAARASGPDSVAVGTNSHNAHGEEQRTVQQWITPPADKPSLFPPTTSTPLAHNLTILEGGHSVEGQEDFGFSFGDEETWDDIFAAAGFSIQEGVFFTQ
ncbi:hypothetical protein BJY04DRAFT_207301 [Aspergillus karnatakaensis]|uniref:uncharacterized protein n=1 Tax=Aspergillus karnatakaensis TaxID=1810916 RepID=UPI003CCE531A